MGSIQVNCASTSVPELVIVTCHSAAAGSFQLQFNGNQLRDNALAPRWCTASRELGTKLPPASRMFEREANVEALDALALQTTVFDLALG